MRIKKINGFMKAMVEKICDAKGKRTLTTATGKHSFIYYAAGQQH